MGFLLCASMASSPSVQVETWEEGESESNPLAPPSAERSVNVPREQSASIRRADCSGPFLCVEECHEGVKWKEQKRFLKLYVKLSKNI